MKWVLAILEVVLRALLPVLRDQLRAGCEDAVRQPQLRERLRQSL